MTTLSILIVSWNTREMLQDCLNSLDTSRAAGNNSAAPPLELEILVVDNNSSDGSAEMVRQKFPHVKLIENRENLGFARANNQAYEASTGEYVLMLNSDTVIHPGALENMVAFMETHRPAAGCGPRLLNTDNSLQISCYPLLTPGREFWRLMFLDRLWRRASYPQERWSFDEPRPVEIIKGACILLRREALEQVGFLDERYFMYTEEMDLCYRLSQAGWQLWWVPQAVVTHHGEASSRLEAEKMYVQLYLSKGQFHRKFGGEHQARRFRRLLQFAYTPRWLATALAARFSPRWAARARTYRRLLAALPDI